MGAGAIRELSDLRLEATMSISRYPIAVFVSLALLPACNGSLTGDDSSTAEEPLLPILHLPPSPPTTSCPSNEKSFAGPGGATVCAGYDYLGKLSYAYSQDPQGTYHRVDVEYPPALPYCYEGKLKFSEGRDALLAGEYFVHDFLVCVDQSTSYPLTELLEFFADGVGSYAYKVDGFNYNQSTAQARSWYTDASTGSQSPLESAKVNLLAPSFTTGFSAGDVPRLFASQLTRAAFFSQPLGGTHAFMNLQINRVTREACMEASKALSNETLSMECELGAALGDFVHARYPGPVNWGDQIYENPAGSTTGTPCKLVVLSESGGPYVTPKCQ
jgi:hypothetical protein